MPFWFNHQIIIAYNQIESNVVTPAQNINYESKAYNGALLKITRSCKNPILEVQHQPGDIFLLENLLLIWIY